MFEVGAFETRGPCRLAKEIRRTTRGRGPKIGLSGPSDETKVKLEGEISVNARKTDTKPEARPQSWREEPMRCSMSCDLKNVILNNAA